MEFEWSFFVDLGIISIALLASTWLRAKSRFLQKYLVPNAITAGFMLMIVYNIFPLRTAGMKDIIFHFLNLSFIAVTLRKSDTKVSGRNIFANSLSVISNYTVQGLIGLGLSFIFIYTIYPDLFPGIGFCVPLGFGLGPGQAFAIAHGWEPFGFKGGGDVGLTFAAIGYLWSIFAGIFIMNYGIKKGWMKAKDTAAFEIRRKKSGVIGRNETAPPGSHLTTDTEAIDSMTFNIGIVFAVYLLSYLFLLGITALLGMLGKLGTDLATNLWGISFIFAAVIALLVKKIFYTLKIEHIIDNGSQSRISGAFVDIMVVGAIAAISLLVIMEYFIPIIVLSSVAGIATTYMVFWMTPRLFTDNQFFRAILLFGALTGTISTGLALLRVIDPDFETPAASDYMYSSGVTFILAIPLILSLNLPAHGYKSGDPIYYAYTMAIFLAYLIFSLLGYSWMSKKRAFYQPSKIWVANEQL